MTEMPSMPPVVADEMRCAVRAAILQCDASALEMIAWEVGLAGFSDEFEAIARAELGAAPHDTQEWWGVPCNCNGFLN